MKVKVLDDIRKYFETQPIEKAWLFGSCSRNEDTSGSDIDILVQYDDNAEITLMTISKIMVTLKKMLNRKVDVVEDSCLLPFARESVDRDKILIYERKS